MIKLDDADKKILNLLQENADMPAAEIGEKVGMSQASCWRRINRLQSQGVITGKAVIVDPSKIGYGTTVLALVKLTAHGRTNLEGFPDKIRSIENVIECALVLGTQDFFIKFAVRDIEEYQRVLMKDLSTVDDIAEIVSMVVVADSINKRVLPAR